MVSEAALCLVSSSYRGLQIPGEEFKRELATIAYLVRCIRRESSPHLVDRLLTFLAILKMFLSQTFGVSVLQNCLTN